MANRDASGVAGLLEGGVGSELDGDGKAILASREGEFGPSTTRAAKTEHAVAVICGG